MSGGLLLTVCVAQLANSAVCSLSQAQTRSLCRVSCLSIASLGCAVALHTLLDVTWHNAALLLREEKLEEREWAVKEHQAEAVALKAELQSLADTMRTQTEKQVKDSAEDKLAASRHQARLDTLQVRHGQPFTPAQVCTLLFTKRTKQIRANSSGVR